jgi:hypothetical protein
MDITDAARLVGALAWNEQRLFEVVGGWVVGTPEHAVKLHFAHASRLHGDHALALTGVLPDTRDHDPDTLVAPPDDVVVASLDEAGDTTVTRLAALGLVQSRQRDSIDAFVREAAAVRDGPALRIARLVLEEDAALTEATAAFGDGNR